MIQHGIMFVVLLLAGVAGAAEGLAWDKLTSPVIFHGDARTAYRDPAAVFHNGCFYLYFSKVVIEADGKPYHYTAWSKSRDLVTWTEPVTFTPRDRNLNFCSPGGVVRLGDEWVLCLCSYPRPNGELYGNKTARLWLLRSKDLEHWSAPELIKVKGPDVPQEKMGRMIDPFIFADKDTPGKWWCSYKQNGMSLSWSTDLKTWHPAGAISAGENTCLIVDGEDYVLFHSPANGMGIKRTRDLKTWRDLGVQLLGQEQWSWAKGRLTAGFVLDLRRDPAVGRALLFFHGSEFPEKDPRGGFDNFASLGLAWSSDLQHWSWPGEKTGEKKP